jgi:hypothetical protein
MERFSMTDVHSAYDPETLTLLRRALDEAWDTLLPPQRARITKSELAQRMLKFAALGERDPVRLRVRAVTEVVEKQSAA